MSVTSYSPQPRALQKPSISEDLHSKLEALQTTIPYDQDRYRPITDRESTVSLSPTTQFLGPKMWDKPSIPKEDIRWIRHAIPRVPGAESDDDEPGSPEWGPPEPFRFVPSPKSSKLAWSPWHYKSLPGTPELTRDGQYCYWEVAPGKVIRDWRELDIFVADGACVGFSPPRSPGRPRTIPQGPVFGRPYLASTMDAVSSSEAPSTETVNIGVAFTEKPRPLRRSKRIAERLRRQEEAAKQDSSLGRGRLSENGITRPGTKSQRNKPTPRGQTKRVAEASRPKGNKDLVSTAPAKARRPRRNVRES